MRAYGITDKGKVRKENQDSLHYEVFKGRNRSLLLVCDGMGGANSGNLASSMAVNLLVDLVRPVLQTEQINPVEIWKTAISQVNTAVYKHSLTSPSFQGMGTTVVGAIIDGTDACVLNIGDSRAYHLTKNGVAQITKDHSLVAELIRRGEITPEQARTHPRKNIITRALGVDPDVATDVFSVHLGDQDALLLCSDGLSNLVTEAELLDYYRKNHRPDVLCKKLLKCALSRGAPDNVTIVVLIP